MEGDWITLATLGSFSGVVFATTLVAQFVKEPLDKVVKIPTRLLVLFVAWFILMGYHWVQMGRFTAAGLFLDLLNGFVVTLAAMGAHSLAQDKLGWK